jgi:RNA polymerase sigma-70 factor (ECF subfamily)
MRAVEEGQLLERAKEYDCVALGELYDRYAAKIYNYIYYQVGDQDLAEDLTANVFTKILDAVRSDKAWQLSFSAWIYRIAHNIVVDHFRRSEHEKALPLNELITAAADDPVSAVERIMSSDSIKKAMRHLTDEQQVVILLKFSEELSNLEVARVMGKTEGAIKSLQYRALAALRRCLEGDSRGKDDKRHRDRS